MLWVLPNYVFNIVRIPQRLHKSTYFKCTADIVFCTTDVPTHLFTWMYQRSKDIKCTLLCYDWSSSDTFQFRHVL